MEIREGESETRPSVRGNSTSPKIDATPGRTYPRYCKGKNGPHLIESEADEVKQKYRGKWKKGKSATYFWHCRKCHNVMKARIQARRRLKPEEYVKDLNINNRNYWRKKINRLEEKLNGG